MLQHSVADDFVIATGETHSIREFLDLAGEYSGVDWKKYVEIDPKYFRPTEVDVLLGDASKAANELGWKPKTSFKELVKMMTESDLRLVEQQIYGIQGRPKKSASESVLEASA
jgi:GDPmannose 4,6-dehydratase